MMKGKRVDRVAKKKQPVLEDVTEIIAYFPWWVGVVHALVSCFVLHSFAVGEIQTSASTTQMEIARIGLSIFSPLLILSGLNRVYRRRGVYVSP